MSYCIFDTRSEAEAYQAQAFQDYMRGQVASPYTEQTERWADPVQRVSDGQGIVKVCPSTDNAGQVIEDAEPEWWGDEL